MSIPTPRYDDFVEALKQSLNQYKSSIEEICSYIRNDPELSEGNRTVIRDVTSSLKNAEELIEYSPISSEKLSADLEKIAESIHEMTTPLFDSYDYHPPKQQSYFEKDMRIFKSVVEHRPDLEKGRGLEFFLDQDWAKEQFLFLCEKKNAWALNKLEELCLKKDKFALENLLILIGNNPKLRVILYQVQDEPFVEKWVEDQITSLNHKRMNQAAFVLGQILYETPDSWAKQPFIKLVKNKPSYLVLRVLKTIFFETQERCEWVRNLVVKDLPLLSDWALDIAYYYAEKKGGALAKSWIDHLKQKALDDPKYLAIIQVFCVFTSKPDLYKLEEVFNKPFGLDADSMNVHKRACHFKAQLETLEHNKKIILPFCWERVTFACKFMFIFMFIKRETQILDFVSGGSEKSPPVKQARVDFFSNTQTILLRGGTNLSCDVEKLAPMFELYSIGAQRFLCEEYYEPDSRPLNVEYIIAEQKTSLWMRDSMREHEEGDFRLTYSDFTFSKRFTNMIESNRTKRVLEHSDLFETEDDECFFSFMGNSMEQKDYLKQIIYFAQTTAKANLSFQLTCNEGGNCLIGEYMDPISSKQVRYALIGKDAVAVTAREFARDLTSMNLLGMLDSDQDYDRIVNSNLPKESPEIVLKESFLKKLFALDLGLDPENIHFIEQPEYHLDVAMAIAGPRTILLNDSLAVFKVMEQYLKNDFDSVKERKNPHQRRESRYKRNLVKLKDRAEAFARHEALAKSDLEKAGFKVISVAGCFQDLTKYNPQNHKINFFNFVTMTSPEGENLLLALGCPEYFQVMFEDMVRGSIEKEKIKIIYLDQKVSQEMLALGGGVHCSVIPLAEKLKAL